MNKIFFTIILSSVLIFGFTSQAALAQEIPSPRQQMENGVAAKDVICKDGYALVLRATSDTAACIKSKSTTSLMQRGWFDTVEKTALEMRTAQKSLGIVTTVSLVERLDSPIGIQPGVKDYNYVFQACAGSKLIRNPEVLVASDSESKSVKLSAQLLPNECQTTSTKIKATDKESISGFLLKKGNISTLVQSLESKVSDLQMKLETEKKNLANLATIDPKPQDYKKQIEQVTDKITSLRQELNNARAELHRNNYLLYVAPPKTVDPGLIASLATAKDKVPFAPQEGPHVNIVNIVNNAAEAKRLDLTPRVSAFNVIFDACAGKDEIKFPEAIINSDSESKSVKIAESIDANSCRTSSTIIKASDKNSVTGVLVTVGGQSTIIAGLEAQVVDLQSQLDAQKQILAQLVRESPPPADFKERVSELTDKIIELRNELNSARAELQKILFMINQ